MARKSSRWTTPSKKSRHAGQRRSASAFYNDILGVAGTLFRNRQQAGAEKISSLSAAARNFASDLTDIPNIQTYAHAAADQMESLGDYVADNSMEQIAEDAMAIAKRHPVATAAFAVAVGFGFTRLMTHNATDQRDEKPMPTTRSARRGTVKRSAPKKRAVAGRAKANGHAKSHERVNAA
jgi:hypothetical protein